MSSDPIPFYTQAAILDQYIHSSNPGENAEVLEIILQTLSTRPDLRTYFFRNRPDPAWTPILVENGFFDFPPAAIIRGGRSILPQWDAQEFLISVADLYPDIVVQHAITLKAHGKYLARAVYALSLIPAIHAITAIDQVVEWQKNKDATESIAEATFQLMVKFAAEGEMEGAFILFSELTKPIFFEAESSVADRLPVNGRVRFRFGWAERENEFLTKGSESLRERDPERVIAILENTLIEVLHLEFADRNLQGFGVSIWWRSTIEEATETQENDLFEQDDYKNMLVDQMRETLEWWVQDDSLGAHSVIIRYLKNENDIFRRLAFFLLYRYPENYTAIVRDELLNPENLADNRIRHEYYLLLMSGFRYLQS